jgi:alkanesulfonate monooxygenase SsuD/methylene tetrahydromethanopterin reductase-like flavin-dependent oxidoreductase (luciferase family)
VRASYRWSVEQMRQNAIVGTPQQVAEEIQAKVDAGVNYVITYFPRVAYDHASLHIFAEEVAPLIK